MPKRPEFEPELIESKSVKRAAYNPREADDFRDDMLTLSIRKFGWLIPAFIDPDDELLSGHQRHRISSALGATRIPVIRTRRLPDGLRRAINLLFNRATNDMDNADSSQQLRQRLINSRSEIIQAVEQMPDLNPSEPEFFPVTRFQWRPVRKLLQANTELGTYGMQAASTALVRHKIVSPLIVTDSGRLINGKGRLPALAAAGYDEAPCTIVPEDRAEVLVKLVNLLTMDFTLHKQYADVLRFNSFRRAAGIKQKIGAAFRFDLYPNGADWDSKEVWDRWKNHYGTNVLDFGAGLLQDTQLLRHHGVNAVPFEPYLLANRSGRIDPDAARTLLREFLIEVATGVEFDSIFQNSVMNSVPFLEDRRHIVRLISALSSSRTRIYCCAISIDSDRAKAMIGHLRSPSLEGTAASNFLLDYEDNVSISDLQTLPKMQKYHKPREWFDLWSEGFAWVKSVKFGSLVAAVCRQPKPVDAQKLRESIEFEFDLPYPDGSRVGLVADAKSAFSKRLGLDL